MTDSTSSRWSAAGHDLCDYGQAARTSLQPRCSPPLGRRVSRVRPLPGGRFVHAGRDGPPNAARPPISAAMASNGSHARAPVRRLNLEPTLFFLRDPAPSFRTPSTSDQPPQPMPAGTACARHMSDLMCGIWALPGLCGWCAVLLSTRVHAPHGHAPSRVRAREPRTLSGTSACCSSGPVV